MLKVSDATVTKAALSLKQYCEEHPKCEGCKLYVDELCAVSFLEPHLWNDKELGGKDGKG